ncbi:MAG: P-loop NTPase fold protein [Candidatus Omnitrophica bacterium]|nr:P-loop NTPase fold protein [Candidatus Omnitrophota bacterium]
MVQIVTNPFTPQSGLEPKILGARDGLVEEVLSLLVKRGRGEQFHLLMLGEWGMGKTSLLKYYKKLSQNKGYKSVYTALTKGDKDESYKDMIFSLLEEISFSLGLNIDISGLFKKFKNIPIATIEAFKNIYLDSNSELLVILIDDVQNASGAPKFLDILRLVLSSEQIIKDTNYLFLLSSTPGGWESFLKRYDPVGRFFRKKQILSKLDKNSLEFTIKNTLLNTGVVFKEGIIENCWHYSEGHPYELQLLANHLYDNQVKGVVNNSCWDVSLVNTIKDLGIEYFSSLYNKASDREKELLVIFAESGEYISLPELRELIIYKKKIKGYPVANIKNFVYRLIDKGLIIRRDDKKCRILDRMFAEYILRFK